MFANVYKKFRFTFFPLKIKSASVLLGVFCIAPMVVISCFFMWSAVNFQAQEADRLSLVEAQNLSFELDAQFRELEQNLYKLRNMQSLKDADLAHFHSEASEFLRSKGQVGAVLIDRSGTVVLSTLRPYGLPLAKLSVDGYQTTFEEPKSTVSELFMGPIDGQWIMVVRVPVWGRKGEVLYALSGILTVKRLENFLVHRAIPPNRITSLIDPIGRLAARTKDPQNTVGRLITPMFQKQLESATSGIFEGYSREGDPARIAFARSAATGWAAAITTPASVLSAELRNSLWPYVIGIGASFAFALLAIFKVGGAISSSIKKLTMLAQYIGAQQIVKPFNSAILEINDVSAAIANASVSLEDAKYHSYHDPLTGLANRALLDVTLEKQVAQAKRMGFAFSLLYLDLDGFKLVNDHYGHAVGDLLLQDFAKKVNGLIREGDTMARLGGDEFVILLAGANNESAQAVAQKIHTSISESSFVLEGVKHDVRCSIGLAVFPRDAADAHGLARKADQALYAAKRAGRNRICNAVDL